jgi:type III secretory pathway lipoprotein EscJ
MVRHGLSRLFLLTVLGCMFGTGCASSGFVSDCQANVLLTMLDRAGIPQEKLGDSTGKLEPDFLSIG